MHKLPPLKTQKSNLFLLKGVNRVSIPCWVHFVQVKRLEPPAGKQPGLARKCGGKFVQNVAANSATHWLGFFLHVPTL